VSAEINPQLFRKVLGQFATGVTIVTTRDSQGRPAGLTANSFTSVSLDPPLVLVCVDYRISSYQAIKHSGSYAVHILTEQQTDLAWRFAAKEVDKFAGLNWQPGRLGDPILEGCIGLLECKVVDEFPGGDHAIFVGRVEHLELLAEAEPPLLFFRGKLGGMAPK
jgi:3-hydroxy-9,10-secoandrosta-1,3,5(10)-triene-9,17-dione monooxygenase reductase component